MSCLQLALNLLLICVFHDFTHLWAHACIRSTIHKAHIAHVRTAVGMYWLMVYVAQVRFENSLSVVVWSKYVLFEDVACGRWVGRCLKFSPSLLCRQCFLLVGMIPAWFTLEWLSSKYGVTKAKKAGESKNFSQEIPATNMPHRPLSLINNKNNRSHFTTSNRGGLTTNASIVQGQFGYL